MGCLTFDELFAELESSGESEATRRHVTEEGCGICARRLELARRLRQVLPSLRLEQPPGRVLSAALKVPSRVGTREPRVLEAVPLEAGLAPAFRSASPAAARGQLYRSGPLEVYLALQEDGALLGELVDDRDGAGAFQGDCILYGERAVQHAELDPDGYFRFDRIGPGAHVLVIERDQEQIVVRDLELPS